MASLVGFVTAMAAPLGRAEPQQFFDMGNVVDVMAQPALYETPVQYVAPQSNVTRLFVDATGINQWVDLTQEQQEAINNGTSTISQIRDQILCKWSRDQATAEASAEANNKLVVLESEKEFQERQQRANRKSDSVAVDSIRSLKSSKALKSLMSLKSKSSKNVEDEMASLDLTSVSSANSISPVADKGWTAASDSIHFQPAPLEINTAEGGQLTLSPAGSQWREESSKVTHLAVVDRVLHMRHLFVEPQQVTEGNWNLAQVQKAAGMVPMAEETSFAVSGESSADVKSLSVSEESVSKASSSIVANELPCAA